VRSGWVAPPLCENIGWLAGHRSVLQLGSSRMTDKPQVNCCKPARRLHALIPPHGHIHSGMLYAPAPILAGSRSAPTIVPSPCHFRDNPSI
jgi:hypothetical protein